MPELSGFIDDPTMAIAALGGLSVVLLMLAMSWRVFFPDHFAQRVRRLAQRSNPAPQIQGAARAPDRDVIAPPSAVIRFLDWLAQRLDWSPDDVSIKLRRAGYHGRRSYLVFLLTKFLAPVVVFPLAWAYLHLVLGATWNELAILVISLAVSVVAVWLPDLLLHNLTLRRKKRLQRGWPDALDLLHLCIDSGMGLETSMARVARELRSSSPDIADELTMTVGELTYLQNRRIALENLSERTDLLSVRETVVALVQSERYGVALAQTLRTLAAENRRQRLAEAEKKAAALPPRLTVPMILFFLPVLFVVILTPAIIQLLGLR